MSSANPGRYQSQLFNFLNRHTQKIGDRTSSAMRNLKVAAVWGVQILLYPVYLAVQATRFVGHQIRQAVQVSPQLQTSNPSSPPTVDTPIQRVLEAVETLPQLITYQDGQLLTPPPIALTTSDTHPKLVETLAVNSSSLHFQTVITTSDRNLKVAETSSLHLQEEIPTGISTQKLIQGVATLLETRTLVLVTPNNQILDILTPQQQQLLASRISWEMANYYLGQNPIQSSRFTKSLSSTAKQKRLLPPLRLFWQVMSWVQQGQVAIAANLFGESTLLLNSEPSFPGTNLTTLVSKKDLIWRHIFPLYQYTTNVSLSKEKKEISPSLAFLDRTIAALDRPLMIATRTLQQYQPGWITVRGSLSTANPSEADRQGIKALIRAAIDYFFGKRSLELPKTDVDSAILTGNQSDRLPPSSETLDPWLTWDDLYSDPISTHPVSQSKPQRQLPNASLLQPKSSFWDAIKRRLSFQSTALQYESPIPSDLAVQEPATTSLKRPAPKRPAQRRKAIAPQGEPPAILAVSLSKSYLDPTPEWIETQATPIGYVKHPLEQLLEWLDRAMLWLEELFVKLWRFIFQR